MQHNLCCIKYQNQTEISELSSDWTLSYYRDKAFRLKSAITILDHCIFVSFLIKKTWSSPNVWDLKGNENGFEIRFNLIWPKWWVDGQSGRSTDVQLDGLIKGLTGVRYDLNDRRRTGMFKKWWPNIRRSEKVNGTKRICDQTVENSILGYEA